jgi:Common central domain of tyrosinase
MMTRRGFLLTCAYLALVSAAGAPRASRAACDRVRRNASFMPKTDPMFSALADAVAKMAAFQQQDLTNRFGTRFIANIHWDEFNDPLSQAVPANERQQFWEQCEHGTGGFFPWHRMYLIVFEELVRALSGHAEFALPYWDAFSHPVLPGAFIGGGAGNALSHPRVRGESNASPLSFVDNFVTYDPNDAVADPTFPEFGGTGEHHVGTAGDLDSFYHGRVHTQIGGDMGQIETAGRDPIFWLHHSNIDRLWSVWLNQGAGRANLTDPAWLTSVWTLPDPHNAQATVTLKTSDVLSTCGVPAPWTPYRYDNETDVQPAPKKIHIPHEFPHRCPKPPEGDPWKAIEVVHPEFVDGIQILSILKRETPSRVPAAGVTIALPTSAEMSTRISSIGLARTAHLAKIPDLATLKLTMQDVRLLDANADFVVFLNLPASGKTRGRQLDYALGSINSWTLSMAREHTRRAGKAHGDGIELTFDLRSRIPRLRALHESGLNNLRVSIVPSVATKDGASQLEVGTVSLLTNASADMLK